MTYWRELALILLGVIVALIGGAYPSGVNTAIITLGYILVIGGGIFFGVRMYKYWERND